MVILDDFSFLVNGTEHITDGTFDTPGTISLWATINTNPPGLITWVLPEPGSVLLLGAGAGLVMFRRRGRGT